MTKKSDFWTALIQLADAMAIYEEHLTPKERLQAIATEFACAPAAQKRQMRLALWAVVTFLEDLSKLIPRSQ